jgi:hypothetical protein
MDQIIALKILNTELKNYLNEYDKTFCRDKYGVISY